MKICLKTAAKLEAPQHVVMTLDERLPCHVQSPVVLNCDYRVDMCHNYHLLTLNVSGVLTLTCQRCLTLFEYDFTHQTMLAICQNEAQAEKLMEQFDCIVAVNGEVNLSEIVADNIHLYAPEKHAHGTDCDQEMRRWMMGQDEILPSTLGL